MSNPHQQDPEYLAKLEAKLARLESSSGRSLKAKEILQQLAQHRESPVASGSVQDPWVPEVDRPIEHNLIKARLFPEQPLRAEELLRLVEFDQLREPSAEQPKSSQSLTAELCSQAQAPAKSAQDE